MPTTWFAQNERNQNKIERFNSRTADIDINWPHLNCYWIHTPHCADHPPKCGMIVGAAHDILAIIIKSK